MTRLNIYFTSVVMCIFSLAGCLSNTGSGRIAVAFYNCENFYDTIDDPFRDDDEFTPNGKCHYTRRVYLQKQHNMATVLQSMDPENGPALIGLAEIENATVLADVVRQPEIADRNYRYILYDGPDVRGIDVALLYDPERFMVISSEPLHIPLDSGTTRDVLHVRGILAGDSLHLFVCHWPSRRGGVEESAARRAAAAGVCASAIAAIRMRERSEHIILMGDLNDNPTDSSVTQVLGAGASKTRLKNRGLYNPFADLYAAGVGTEVYKHQWNLFDQIVISAVMLHSGPLRYAGVEVYKPAFLQNSHKGHEGEPKRAFLGSSWMNGYSDHFPVLLYFEKK